MGKKRSSPSPWPDLVLGLPFFSFLQALLFTSVKGGVGWVGRGAWSYLPHSFAEALMYRVFKCTCTLYWQQIVSSVVLLCLKYLAAWNWFILSCNKHSTGAHLHDTGTPLAIFDPQKIVLYIQPSFKFSFVFLFTSLPTPLIFFSSLTIVELNRNRRRKNNRKRVEIQSKSHSSLSQI